MNQDFTPSVEDTHPQGSEASPVHPIPHSDNIPHHPLHPSHLQLQQQTHQQQTSSQTFPMAPYIFSRNSQVSNAPPLGSESGGFPENAPTGHSAPFSLGGLTRNVEQHGDVTHIEQVPATFHNQQEIETETDEVECIRNAYKNKQSLPLEANTMSFQHHPTWPAQSPFFPTPAKFVTKTQPSSLFTNFHGANMYPSVAHNHPQSVASIAAYPQTHRRTPVTHTVTSSASPPNTALFQQTVINNSPSASNVFTSSLEAGSASEAIGEGLRALLQLKKLDASSPTAVLPTSSPKHYVPLPVESPEPPIVPGGNAAVVAAAMDDIEDAEASDSSSKDNELTPEERERKLRRRQQNKEAAQRCRERKRAKAKDVFKEYQVLECSNTDLRYQIRVLKKELEDLQKTYNEHLPHCIRAPTTTS